MAATYIEQVEGWELSVTGTGTKNYGSGSRTFVGVPTSHPCTTALPAIGDTMVNPENAEVFVGIYCTELNYKRTHTTDEAGLTVIASYSSNTGSSQSQNEEDKEAGSFSADLVTLNVQGATTWFWYTNNAADGATTAFPLEPIPAADIGGPCAENLPISVMQIQRTKRIQFADESDLEAWIPKIQTYGGKLNNAEFLGFAKGQVLLGGISGSMNGGRWDVDVVFIIRKVSDASVTQDDWNFMPTDAAGAVIFNRPMRCIPTLSPGPGFISANGYSYMYEYADISKILDTSAPVPPPAP